MEGMVCSRGSWDRTFYMVECMHPIIGLSGEGPATAGTPKAQAPPGNAQAHERQTAGALESGGRPWLPPTEGERRRRRPISQVTGQRGGKGIRIARPFIIGSGAPVTRHTALFDLHQELGARMVDFGGWDMPLQYGSQIAEHHAVRRGAGVFDVSHMCVVDLKGARVRS